MSFRNRLFLIMKAEKIQGHDFADLCEVPPILINKLYRRVINVLPDHDVLKITHHPRFNKYTLWLMIGKTAPASGQIDPALFPVCAETQITNR